MPVDTPVNGIFKGRTGGSNGYGTVIYITIISIYRCYIGNNRSFGFRDGYRCRICNDTGTIRISYQNGVITGHKIRKDVSGNPIRTVIDAVFQGSDSIRVDGNRGIIGTTI